MRTAVDASVLLRVLKREAGWEAWRDRLQQASEEGLLLGSPILFAEVAAGYASVRDVEADWSLLRIQYDPIAPAAAYLAGQVFRAYRREGGPRKTLIPDFLVAAHAKVQADRLAALDRGYLRRYFPDLVLLGPA